MTTPTDVQDVQDVPKWFLVRVSKTDFKVYALGSPTTFAEDISRLHSMCQRFVSPPIDVESLAMDIYLELASKQMPITWMFIRNRCIDAIRTTHEYPDTEVALARAEKIETSNLQDVDRQDEVTEIISRAGLSHKERRLLWDVFYAGKTFAEIASGENVVPRTIGLRVASIIRKLKHTAQKHGLAMADMDSYI